MTTESYPDWTPCTDPDHDDGCPCGAGGDAIPRPVRTYHPGDRVRIRRGTYTDETATIRAVHGTYEDGYGLTLDLARFPVAGRGLSYSPSEVDLAEVGDRMHDDAGSDWRQPDWLHSAVELTGGTVPRHAPGAYPRLSCCGGPVLLVPAGA